MTIFPVTEEPLIRIMALHALGYCERLFYLEEVEEIRVADQAVYDGRRFHEQLPEYVEMATFHLQSEKLGIQGKVDCVRTEKGEWIPFEYKKGRSRSDQEGQVFAWPSDELQITAYGMLLEEHFGRQISEARVYYAADHRTAKIPLDSEIREKVFRAIQRARELRKSLERPPVVRNENLCVKCSLAPVCLPEEERLLTTEKTELPRYFPPDRDLLDLHVIQPGSTVRRAAGSFVLQDKDGNVREYPGESLGSITIHGNSQITTQAIQLASLKKIHIHWMTTGGKYLSSLSQAAGGTQRRLRQYAALTNEDMAIKLARALIQAKIEGQLRYILRLTRQRERSHFESNIEIMRMSLKNIKTKNPNREQLLGFEGMAAKAYFECISLLTHENEDSLFFDGRNKRPPRDPANAVLSFLCSLLYRDTVQAIITVGLDPTIGFYHQPRSAAYPLALDLMELFRVMICDTLLIGTIHRNQWDLEEDFSSAGKQVWLTEKGKKKAITAYEKRKQDSWKHPVVGYSLSYDRTIELEVRLLEKEWTGAPGLFAMNRIR